MINVLFYIFVSVVAIQFLYYCCFSRFVFYKNPKKKIASSTPISVIICAKNEAQNLQEFLPSILNQNYPNFEVVLINDASSDETLDVMEQFEKDNKHIKIVNVKNTEAFWGNKKYALTLGIKAAKNEHLLFIDADCKPVTSNWIGKMSNQFSSEKTIVLGYGKYMPKKFSLVNILVRFETLLTAIQYFTYALFGSPYMAVGRNLAYTKSTFFSVNGFINHIKIFSGDDDLFIQDAATKTNTAICISKNSFTISKSPTSFKEWFQQKRRHISTANHYKKKHQFFLSLFFITKVLFYILAAILYVFYPWKMITAIILGYFFTQYIVIGFSAKKLQERHLIYFLPFLEIGLLLFQFIIFIANSISKPTHWK